MHIFASTEKTHHRNRLLPVVFPALQLSQQMLEALWSPRLPAAVLYLLIVTYYLTNSAFHVRIALAGATVTPTIHLEWRRNFRHKTSLFQHRLLLTGKAKAPTESKDTVCYGLVS